MNRTPTLAIVTTHPVQYYAPVFRELSRRGVVHPRVYYGWKGLAEGGHDPGFDRRITWDVALLEGYEFTFVPNESARPGSDHRNGIVSRDLVPMLRAAAPDAILVVGWNYRSHLDVLRTFHGRVPILFRGDSTLLDDRLGPRTQARRVALRWVYRHVDHALYAGANNRRYFEAHGIKGKSLSWAPHSVDNDRFADPTGAYERQAAAWRESLGIPAAARVVVFAGKLEPKKAPDVLLRAFERLDPASHHLVVAGSGPMEATLRDASRGRPNVHFVGFQNQSMMPVVYRLGEVLALPSRGPGETWGLAVNEAMASGRPAIVTNRVGCAPDLVLPGRTGFVVAPEDDAALASAILSIEPSMQAESSELIKRWSVCAAAEAIETAVTGMVA
jgi:glycosyltransferase involved in cell wall biosynthesis